MMINFSLIAILTLCGVHSMKNGRLANVGEFPFVVSIQQQFVHLCSGTIINEKNVLSAAHVVMYYPTRTIAVVAGMTMVKHPWEKLSSVEKIFIHPHYSTEVLSENENDPSRHNDIAVLELGEPLVWSPTVAPMSLSTIQVASYPCWECTMISWSFLNENTPDAVILMWDVVLIMDNSHCDRWDIHVLPNQHCFADLFETAFISSEDIGSPIICGNAVVGFISREGKNGITASPSIFQSTLNYTEFISDVKNGGQADVLPEDYPYAVSIWSRTKYMCGGIIININQVITVGHCLKARGRTLKVTHLKVAAGNTAVSRLDEESQWYAIGAITIHPNFEGGISSWPDESSLYIDNDIAIITLNDPFVWSPTVSSIRLADEENLLTQSSCQVLHWKRENIGTDKESRRLMKSEAIMSRSPFEMPRSELRTFEFAARNPYSVQIADPLDAGNPIICEGHPLGMLIKVESINTQCQTAELRTPYMIFLRIRPYVSSGFLKLNSETNM